MFGFWVLGCWVVVVSGLFVLFVYCYVVVLFWFTYVVFDWCCCCLLQLFADFVCLDVLGCLYRCLLWFVCIANNCLLFGFCYCRFGFALLCLILLFLRWLTCCVYWFGFGGLCGGFVCVWFCLLCLVMLLLFVVYCFGCCLVVWLIGVLCCFDLVLVFWVCRLIDLIVLVTWFVLYVWLRVGCLISVWCVFGFNGVCFSCYLFVADYWLFWLV